MRSLLISIFVVAAPAALLWSSAAKIAGVL
jgi:hypothetical protein